MALKARGNLRSLKPASRAWPRTLTYVDSLINEVVRLAGKEELVVAESTRRAPKRKRDGRRCPDKGRRLAA